MTNTSMKITIVGHPNSKKPRIEKDLFGTMHIYVSEPPLEGKANKAILTTLAKHFHIGKNAVTLVSGQKSKFKVFEISENYNIPHSAERKRRKFYLVHKRKSSK